MSGVAWPEPTLADLVIVLLSFGPPLLLGVPKVLRTTRQPAEHVTEPLSDAELAPAQRRWLAQLDRRFAALGYQPADTRRVTNAPFQSVAVRFYASPADPALAAACALGDVRGGVRNSSRWLAFSTHFADGTGVSTVNLRRSWVRRRLAGPGKFGAPGNEDPARLFAAHQRHRASAMTRGPRFIPPEGALENFHASSRREVAWMCEIGWFRRLPDGNLAPTLRGALWIALDAFLPAGDQYGLGRAASGLVAGAACAALATMPAAAAAFGSPLLAGSAGLVAGAAAVGLLLPGRAVFWAPIAVWAGARLVEPALAFAGPWTAAAVATIATIVGQRASNLVARLRDRTSGPPRTATPQAQS